MNDFLVALSGAFKVATLKDLQIIDRLLNDTYTRNHEGERNPNGLSDKTDQFVFWRLLSHLVSKGQEFTTSVDELTNELVKDGEVKMNLAHRINSYLVFCRDREILNVKFGPSPHPLRSDEAPVSIDTGLLFFKWGFKRKEAT